MIDWLTCRIPCTLPRPIDGGSTLKLDRAGNVLLRVPHRMMVEGSFSSTMSVRAPSVSELEISGNVAKWLSGHNLYGIDCPRALLWAALKRLEGNPEVLPYSLASIGLHGPQSLDATILTRVDCTGMLTMGSPGDVLTFIRSAGLTGTLSHRGRGVMREGTLIFGDAKGKSFTRSQIVIYSKGQEIAAHPLPDLMMTDPDVLSWVNKCLRVEVRLGRLELEKQGLRLLKGFCEGTALLVWRREMGKLTFSDAVLREEFDLEKLPKSLRATFAFWKTGADVRRLISKSVYYRNRAAIRDLTGVDISLPPAPVATCNVVPIKRVLEASWAGRPHWADRIDGQLRDGGAIVLPFAA